MLLPGEIQAAAMSLSVASTGETIWRSTRRNRGETGWTRSAKLRSMRSLLSSLVDELRDEIRRR